MGDAADGNEGTQPAAATTEGAEPAATTPELAAAPAAAGDAKRRKGVDSELFKLGKAKAALESKLAAHQKMKEKEGETPAEGTQRAHKHAQSDAKIEELRVKVKTAESNVEAAKRKEKGKRKKRDFKGE